MEYTYLVGEGEQAENLIQHIHSKRTEFNKAVDALIKLVPGSIGPVTGGPRGRMLGFVFPGTEQLTPEQCKRYGLNHRPEHLDGCWCYKPDKRTTKGKHLARRIDSANRKHVDAADYIVEKTGTQHRAVFGRTLYSTFAGYKDDKVFIRIPGNPDSSQEHGLKFPKHPNWLRSPQGFDEWNFILRR